MKLPPSFSDRSMLEALGSPGERSILAEQTEAGDGDRDGDGESREDGDSQRDDEKQRQSKENAGGHRSLHSEEESRERKDGKRRDVKEEEEGPDEDFSKENKGESRCFHPKANASRTLMRASCHQRTD